MVTKRGTRKTKRTTGKRVKALSTKAVSAEQAKKVKGGTGTPVARYNFIEAWPSKIS